MGSLNRHASMTLEQNRLYMACAITLLRRRSMVTAIYTGDNGTQTNGHKGKHRQNNIEARL